MTLERSQKVREDKNYVIQSGAWSLSDSLGGGNLHRLPPISSALLNLLTEGLRSVVIMTGELAGYRLGSVYSAEENSWSSIISRRWRRGNGSDTVGDKTGTGAGVNRG